MANRASIVAIGRLMTLLVTACALAGCPLDKPDVEDRWTRIDVVASNPTLGESWPAGTSRPVTLTADVTYRAILTGFAVAELRASSALSSSDLAIRPDADRVRMAEDIDRLLPNSVSLGRSVRAVTGWDHLIQRIDFTFTGSVPTTLDSTGAARGLFLVCYLGSGERIELPDGTDSIAVTPYVSSERQILPVGLTLSAGSPTP